MFLIKHWRANVDHSLRFVVLDDVTSLFGDATSAVASKFDSVTSVVGSAASAVHASESGEYSHCLPLEYGLIPVLAATSLLAEVTKILGTETQSAFATIVSEYTSRTPIAEPASYPWI